MIGWSIIGFTKKAANVCDRMELFLQAFERWAAPEEREMQHLIKDLGGADEVRNNDKALQQLIEDSTHLNERGGTSTGIGASSGSTSRSVGATIDKGAHVPNADSLRASSGTQKLTVESVRQELTHLEKLDDVLRKHLETYGQKFDLQQRQLKEDLEKVAHREGDRIIAAVTAGTHDRILDEDMHTLWKAMVCQSLILFSGIQPVSRNGRAALKRSIFHLPYAIILSKRCKLGSFRKDKRIFLKRTRKMHGPCGVSTWIVLKLFTKP
jgi:hypothetical protein